MMSSDGNKKEEKGDKEVIILCSSRTSRFRRCPISDKAISANDQRTRPRYYRIPKNQSLSMLELHRGWLLCDFCKGQKMNVKSETNRIYGRCPSCRTVSFELLLTIESPITFCFRGKTEEERE
ncbi:uncharacterized protein LOC126631842 isoform X5 [Malus sylvestris]|uniref:uncharacterized protein LOC126631842 isoform X5 n=1 Tax=Malus sylvestris TaxID=3752 RepID=UPI0021ACAA4C|nr:uncharacterized protein LOC126631842 isoform X5 [Malus sylvestris]